MCPASRTTGRRLVVKVSIMATTKYTKAILCLEKSNENICYLLFYTLHQLTFIYIYII